MASFPEKIRFKPTITMEGLLPEEIIADILSRVPTKSVMRFRCVCKPWCKLTSESTFIQMHFNQFTKKQGYEKEENMNLFLASKSGYIDRDVKSTITYTDGREDSFGEGTVCLRQTHLYCVNDDKAVEIENPFEPSFDKTHLLGSCNGLVCLLSKSRLCLFNPATKEYKLLSFPKNLYSDGKAFYGFGYTSADDVYKLVKLVRRYDDKEYSYIEGNIYSLNDTSIALSQRIGNVSFDIMNTKKSGILLNETLHWVGKAKYKFYPRIVSFNLRENVFEEVPRPHAVKKESKISIGVLGGQLCVLSKFRTSMIEIWVMKNYGEENSWTKLFAMEENVIPSIPMSSPYSYDNMDDKYMLNLTPLYFSVSGEVLITNGRDLVFYDPLRKEARNLEIHGITDRTNIEKVVTYIASLVNLKSGTYAREEEQADDKWENLRVHIQSHSST